MKVTVKLFANFRTGRFKEEVRDYPAGTRIRSVVLEIGLKEEELGVVMVNGRHAPLEEELRDGDALALFPLVGGG